MPSESQGTKNKRLKHSITFFVCLGLKRTENQGSAQYIKNNNSGPLSVMSFIGMSLDPMCKKKNVKTSITFFVCLGLKRADF